MENRFTGHNILRRNLGGFTLLEMIIAVGIFSIVMVVGISIIVNAINHSRKTALLRSTIENVNISLESMTKKMRTGHTFFCHDSDPITGTMDCLDGANRIAFEGQDGRQYVYHFDEDDESIKLQINTNNPQAITSPEIKVKSLRFYVSGSDPTDNLQPFVTVTISGIAELPGKEDLDTDFFLQTSVSQRLLDICDPNSGLCS